MTEYKLPQKWDIYKFTGLPYFNEWENGIQANDIYFQKKDELESLRKKLHILSIALVILGFVILANPGGSDNANIVVLSPFIIWIVAYQIRKHGYLTRMFVDEKLDSAYLEWEQVLYKHTDIFIAPLANKLMSGKYYSYRMGQECFIYGNNGFIYFDTYNSLLVAYDKSNIKDIQRERVHTGTTSHGSASTRGGAYTYNNGVTLGAANTDTYSNTVNEFEWRFDIFTDFIDYPTLSFVFEDTKAKENFTGKFYALLRP